MLSTSLRAVPLVYVILFIFVNQNLLNGENKSEVIKMINEWQPRISLWRSSCDIERRKSIADQQITGADVVVIGAGLAGILTAYMLNSLGVETIVIEANAIGSGVTQNTTAKITSQHDIIYQKLIKDFGYEKARQYANANEWAIKNYRKLIEEMDIDCDLVDTPAYLFTINEEQVDRIREEAKAAKSLELPAEFIENIREGEWGLPFSAKAALRFDNQARFHPLKFLKAISGGLRIYENTRALDVEYNDDGTSVIITEKGNLKANHVVFATHYPFINMPGYYFARLHQERAYLMAFSQAQNVKGAYLGIDQKGYTFRNHNDFLIFGGESHRTGENQEGGRYDSLRQALQKWYPGASEDYAWSAQDCVTIDLVPYIGRYASSHPNWYVATGFRKWGMTHSMVSAAIISTMIAKKAPYPEINEFFNLGNEDDSIYTPQRFNVTASVKNLWDDVKTISKALLKEVFDIPEDKFTEIKKGHGGIVEYEGEKIGAYRDEEGKLYIVDTRCKHMGCQLAWNPDELTWECPCHGSRFDYKGNLITGPATKDLDKI